jgi:hypothetical protein
MQMQMKHGLARAFAVVHHRSIAVLQIQFACELRRNKLQFPENALIL